MLRSALKTAIGTTAKIGGANAFARWMNSDKVAVLAYHNVVEDRDAGRGDASLHLRLSDFLEQIDRIGRTHSFVSLDDVDAVRSDSRPRAVITFDDAYRGAVLLALPALRERGIPAVVFTSPGQLGSFTWWDELAEANLLSAEFRASALSQHGGRADVIRATVARTLPPRSELPACYGIASHAELAAQAHGTIRVGSHAWNHEHLPSLTSGELTENLTRTREWLADSGLPTSDWLALPYGAGTPELGSAIEALGHAGVMRINGGLWGASSGGRNWVPRINVPAGIPAHALELRTSGLVAAG